MAALKSESLSNSIADVYECSFLSDEIYILYPTCPICGQPIYDEHDAYEVQVTYLGWKERTNKWIMCAGCFETTQAGMIFNKATNFIADRRFRTPPYQLRKVLSWYAQDVTRDLIRFIRQRRFEVHRKRRMASESRGSPEREKNPRQNKSE